jgi:hypothetical protein
MSLITIGVGGAGVGGPPTTQAPVASHTLSVQVSFRFVTLMSFRSVGYIAVSNGDVTNKTGQRTVPNEQLQSATKTHNDKRQHTRVAYRFTRRFRHACSRRLRRRRSRSAAIVNQRVREFVLDDRKIRVSYFVLDQADICPLAHNANRDESQLSVAPKKRVSVIIISSGIGCRIVVPDRHSAHCR